jgi:hypothetical protein
MKRILSNYLTELLLLAGCVCILVSLAQWSLMITWLAGGWMLIGWAFLVGKGRS